MVQELFFYLYFTSILIDNLLPENVATGDFFTTCRVKDERRCVIYTKIFFFYLALAKIIF